MLQYEPHVLILDDEADMRALLRRYLTAQGFNVHTAEDARQMSQYLRRRHFDVLVLDIMLPGDNGLDVCRRLRAEGETVPILMLTARGDPADRVAGLDMGADDYLAKPFEPRELSARLLAMVRRQTQYSEGSHSERESSVEFGPFRLELGERVLYRNNEAVELTSGEFMLLRALARNPGRPLGRDRLLVLAGGKGAAKGLSGERSIDVQILRLRRIIEVDPAMPQYIHTVWGAGYQFVPNKQAVSVSANDSERPVVQRAAHAEIPCQER